MLSTVLSGLLTGFSLIIAIGAQNAFVLRQGLRREHIAVVVAICAVSDALLIVAGTVGIGTLVTQAGWLLVALKWLGVIYLCWFAFTSFRSALHPGKLASAGPARSQRGIILTTLALTYLNPHVYLDTVVMLGNLANQQGSMRWVFAGGAAAASLIWFTAIGFGARSLSGPLGRPRTWQVLDMSIGVVMLTIAVKLAVS